MRVIALTALCVLLLVPIASAGSRACGDDVDGHGRAVPCDCGDVLVSSRTLGEADPISHHSCTTTGLIVSVPRNRPAATLNLGGHTLAGGGRGIGIHVVSGGDRKLFLTGPGTIRGFDVGVFAPHGGLVRAEDVTASDNRSDGFHLGGAGYTVVRCTAQRNGRTGFALSGVGFGLEGNRALENGRVGFTIAGHNAAVGGERGNEATANGGTGLVLRGQGHVVQRAETTGNGGGGVLARMSRGQLVDVVAKRNKDGGLKAVGRDLVVAGSTAAENGGPGIDVHGARFKDGGGNQARGNVLPSGGAATSSRPRPRAECRLGVPCR